MLIVDVNLLETIVLNKYKYEKLIIATTAFSSAYNSSLLDIDPFAIHGIDCTMDGRYFAYLLIDVINSQKLQYAF